MLKFVKSILGQLCLMTIIVCLLVIFSTKKIVAQDYTVALTTYTVDAGTTNFMLGGYPNIAGGVKIDQIVFSNTGEQQQFVQIYDLGDSSQTAVVAFQVMIPTNSTPMDPVIVNWPFFNRLKLRNMAAKQLSTGSTVWMNVNYK